MRWSLRRTLAVVVVVAGGALLASRAWRPATPAPAEPYIVPATLSPVAHAVAARHAGQVVLLDVWATWCDNCLPGLADLMALQQTYGARGLRVVAISVDEGLDSAAVQRWALRHGLTLELAYDPSGASTAMLGRPGVPIGLLLDRQGRVRETRFGHAPRASDMSWHAPWMQAKFETLLAEPPSTGTGSRPGA
ncbi:TlpA disulfide reductase family protein [Roseisolibacter agri]|nr:TlpA disulfide reductase family protein [Roseisolibacter agri]